jgi:alkanesulfonate monooxygenase SsuD/methylene tetrahydromethanopterin reductase-like flavin-dependent oxidoreductase (luciferase family)
LQRVAKLADGWIGAGGASTEAFASQLQTLNAALAQEGRDPAGFPTAKRVYIGVVEDAAGEERFISALDGLYAAPGFARQVGVCGTAEHCAQRLRELLDSGVGELILTPVHDYLEQLERVAEIAGLVGD